MSELQTRLQDDLNTARKAQDRPLTLLLSTLLADAKNRRIELLRDLTDEEVTEVLRRGIKRRRESIEMYEKGQREDLAEKEREEVRMLERYLPPAVSDDEIRAAVRAASVAENHAALALLDPRGTSRLNPGDTTRIARALEVVRSTKRTLAEWQEMSAGGIGEAVALRPLLLLPPRDWLVERCDRRFAAMVDEGAVAEVEALLARDLDPDLPVMRAIGVRELGAWVRDETSRAQAIAAGQLATRRYAKRQYTWFANQPPKEWPRWTEALDDPAAALALFTSRCRVG